MRKGTNPAKAVKVEADDAYHRIIIPVYIPNLEGFFKESFEVLKICLKSLYTTAHNKTRISISSNGSCKEVNDFFGEELEAKRIDELFIVKRGIGKINSLYKIINSTKEPILTISDADVLFTTGWQEAVERVFTDYKKVGMVSPFSHTKGFRSMTANIYYDNFFNKNIKVTKVENPEALEHFAKSIDNENFYGNIHKKYGVVYQKKGKSKVLLGAGHFVATFKRNVFQPYVFNSNLQRLSSGENEFIDLPPLKAGLWRFSTTENYVYHMGNTIIPMYDELIKKNVNDISTEEPRFPKVQKEHPWLYYLKNKLFARYFFSNRIFSWYLRRIGFTRQEAKEYLNIK